MTTTWEDLNAMFLHDPKLVTKYAIKTKVLHKPGWYAAETYLESTSDINTMKRSFKVARKQSPVFKFGVEVPQTVQHAFHLDQKNNNTKWRDAINKELEGINEYETFKSIEDDKLLPDEYKQIPYHSPFSVVVHLV